jgi:hypothetical protein
MKVSGLNMTLRNDHPSLSSSADVAEIIRPIQELGIAYFSYMRSYKDGSRVYLISNDDVLKTYFSKKLYIVFWSTLPKQYIYDENMRSRGLDHGIFMIEPHADYCDFYGFAAKKENDRVINTYINKVGELKTFTHSFKGQAAKILPFHEDPLTFIEQDAKMHFSVNAENDNGLLQPRALSGRRLECAMC